MVRFIAFDSLSGTHFATMDTMGKEHTRDSIYALIDKTGTCWLWRGSVTSEGYGTVGYHHISHKVHRLIYEWEIGAIPSGQVLDHVKERCGHKNCCNPDHLEPVTFLENLRRGPHANRERTQCKRGHEFTPENTAWTTANKRLCRECHAMRARLAREKRRKNG